MKKYIDIQMLEDPQFTFNEVYKVIHGVISNQKKDNQETMAVDFPQWQQGSETKKTFIGNAIRVFGSSEQLSVLIQTKKLKALTNFGSIFVSEIKDTPQTSVYICNYRNNKFDKQNQSRELRKKQYQEAKFGKYTPKERLSADIKNQLKTQFGKDCLDSTKQENENNTYFLTLQSASNQQTFNLYITRMKVDSALTTANNYGLANSTNKQGVPFF